MALVLDLSQIRGPREHVERLVPADAFHVADDDLRVVNDIALSLDVEKQNERYHVVGSVQAELELPCSRCLEPMRWPVDARFDLQYLPSASNVGDEEQEVAAEDLGVAFYENQAIDLGQLIREQFYLALPMKPLCRPGCEGLCPECGTNLNLTRCNCEHRWVDPRMAPLAQLLPRTPRED
jgi:uncharacterized protein